MKLPKSSRGKNSSIGIVVVVVGIAAAPLLALGVTRESRALEPSLERGASVSSSGGGGASG